MYKLFFGAFFVVFLFFLFLVFPKDSFAQSCGGGSYYCGDFYETCTLPSGRTCFGFEDGCTCSISCTGGAGDSNACSAATDATICNSLSSYACRETPCGFFSGSCSWNSGGGGGGGGGGAVCGNGVCSAGESCSSCAADCGSCDPCAGGGRSYCNGGSSPYFCCGSNLACSPNSPTNTNFNCVEPTPPPSCPGGTNACADTCYNGEDTSGSPACAANPALYGGSRCCNLPNNAPTPPPSCPAGTNVCANTCYNGENTSGSAACASNPALYGGSKCCVAPNNPPQTTSPCPISPSGGGTNTCRTGSCQSGESIYGSSINNACGAGRVCCYAPPATGGSCASSGGVCMANGFNGSSAGCPSGQVRQGIGSLGCSGLTPTCYTCVPASVTNPPVVTTAPTNCVNGASCTGNAQCSGAPFGGFCSFDGAGLNGRCQCNGEPPGGGGSCSGPGGGCSAQSPCCTGAGYPNMICIASVCALDLVTSVTIQGRLVNASNQSLSNGRQIAGQGVRTILNTGIYEETNSTWSFIPSQPGTYTVRINQVPGYTTRYRCNQGNCGGVPSAFTTGTQVTFTLSTPGDYIDLYVQYLLTPTCSSMTRNARSGSGGVPATGVLSAGGTVNLFANIINDDGDHTNSSWTSTCGTFTSTNWDYATFRAPATGSCSISYTLNGQAQPACTGNFTTCSGSTNSQTVSGNIFVDTAGNNCATGATAYSSTPPNLTLRGNGNPKAGPVAYNSSTNPGYTLTDSVACTTEERTVGISQLPLEYVVKAYRMGNTSQPWVDHSGFQVVLPSTTNSTVDWCVSTNSSWFQTQSGDVRYPSLLNKVPALEVGSESLPTSPNTPGIFISSNGLINDVTFGQGAVSNRGWKVSDEYDYNDDFKNGLGGMSYTFYNSQARRKELPKITISSSTFSFTDAVASGIYHRNGDLTISASSLTTSGKHIIILASGNITITGDIKADTGRNNLIVVAAQGNITVSPTVGTASMTSTVSNLDGYYTAEEDIVLGTSANCATGVPDRRLNISGAIIANSLRPFALGGSGEVDNRRTLCSGNAGNPSLFVSARPEFLLQLTDFYKTTYKVYTEVSP